MQLDKHCILLPRFSVSVPKFFWNMCGVAAFQRFYSGKGANMYTVAASQRFYSGKGANMYTVATSQRVSILGKGANMYTVAPFQRFCSEIFLEYVQCYRVLAFLFRKNLGIYVLRRFSDSSRRRSFGQQLARPYPTYINTARVCCFIFVTLVLTLSFCSIFPPSTRLCRLQWHPSQVYTF